MHRVIAGFCIAGILLAALPPAAHAKRMAPKPVTPVIAEGVRYTAPNDRGRACYVEAWDVATGKRLWEQVVCTVRIDPQLEEDVQWSFITSLAIEGGSLVIRTERSDTYLLDLKTRTVTRREPAAGAAGKDSKPAPAR